MATTLTYFQSLRPYTVEFSENAHLKGGGNVWVVFQGEDGHEDRVSIYFSDITIMKALFRAALDDLDRKQEAQRYNPHNVGFAERAAEADRLAREVERV